jgi:hypothetical protein
MLEAGVQANEAPRLIPDSSFKLVVGIRLTKMGFMGI